MSTRDDAGKAKLRELDERIGRELFQFWQDKNEQGEMLWWAKHRTMGPPHRCYASCHLDTIGGYMQHWDCLPRFSSVLDACREAERRIEAMGMAEAYVRALINRASPPYPFGIVTADAATRCRAMLTVVAAQANHVGCAE